MLFEPPYTASPMQIAATVYILKSIDEGKLRVNLEWVLGMTHNRYMGLRSVYLHWAEFKLRECNKFH